MPRGFCPLFSALCGALPVVLALLWTPAAADDWPVPTEVAALANPLPADDRSVLEAGRTIYEARCQRCHGETGEGDGPDARKISVEPTNFARRHPESDGTLFYKTKHGKKPMPKYGNRLSDTEIWQVVRFLRFLGEGSDKSAPGDSAVALLANVGRDAGSH